MSDLYRNHQWRVTKHGMESIKPAPTYEFEAKRLSETTDRSGAIYYDWPIHMAEKNWVDLDAFIDAFSRALDLHAGRYDPPKDGDMLADSIAYAKNCD